MNASSHAPRTTAPRQPEAIQSVIARAMDQWAGRHDQAGVLDFPTWKALVGARVARHAQPTAVQHGQLRILVEDSALLYTISWRAPTLLAALRQALPDQEIRELTFSIGAVAW